MIFDCDGTLVDSETVATDVMVDYLAELGMQLSAEVALARFKGGRMADCVAELEQMFGRRLAGLDFTKVLRDRIAPVYCISACSRSKARWNWCAPLKYHFAWPPTGRCTRLKCRSASPACGRISKGVSSVPTKSAPGSRRRTCSCMPPGPWASNHPVAR